MDEKATRAEQRSEANSALGTGLGIGVFGLASAALVGAVCPLCVIAAPALIGYGVYKRVQCRKASADSSHSGDIGAMSAARR